MSKITLDQDEIKQAIFDSLKDKISSAINYTELHTLIEAVLVERKDEFDKLIIDMFDSFFTDSDMRKAMLDEFKHKVAKTMVSKLDGAVESSINKYRQDPTTNARMILAIEKIIKDEEDK